MVVSVGVGFRYMSVGRLDWFRIVKGSRQFIPLLLSCVGLNWKFVCIRFMKLCTVSVVT